MGLKQTKITCTNTDTTKIADILQKTDKLLKVAISGTDIVVYLNKKDLKNSYVGNYQKLEFTSTGEEL